MFNTSSTKQEEDQELDKGWNMNRQISSMLLQPRSLLIFVVATILIFLAFPFSQQQKEEVEVRHDITHRVFLDVDVDKQRVGRIVIGLYGEVVPKTTENFRALCTGEMGKHANGKALHYKGTPFHRIIPGFMIQGGDIVNGNGSGNISIYGSTFRDENFKIKHSHPGVVSMVNPGPDSNGSQFFITTVKASWLDGEHVVFGRVIEGMDTVYVIEGAAGTYSGKPRKKVLIADSGEISKSEWEAERERNAGSIIERSQTKISAKARGIVAREIKTARASSFWFTAFHYNKEETLQICEDNGES